MRRGRPPYPDLLTPREEEVLSLIRDGLTNEQIAAHLAISESGARYHVSEILSKLGVSSRKDAAAWLMNGRPSLPATLPLFVRLQGLFKFAAAASVIAAALGIIVLAAGVAVMSSRNSSGPATPVDSPPRSPELQDFLTVVEDAIIEARALMPRAELYMVASGAGGIFTFRFMQADSDTEMAVVGPNVADPSLPRWQHFPDQSRDSQTATPEPLDLTGLENTPETAAEVFQSVLLEETNVRLLMQSGELVWFAQSRPGSGPLPQPTGGELCRVPDSDLTSVDCPQR